MKYASEDLMNEHEGILFGLKILEKMVLLLRQQKKVNTEDLKEITGFLSLFADKCHHGKEEGLLFPAMEKAGIQKDGGPIGQMLLEHVEGRNFISRMKHATEKSVPDLDQFADASSGYITLLRAHIEKENTVLFPMGDRMIPADQQAELLEAFEKFEEEVMGKGTHEKLHHLLHEFEGKYLS